jgi:hypothetical protein
MTTSKDRDLCRCNHTRQLHTTEAPHACLFTAYAEDDLCLCMAFEGVHEMKTAEQLTADDIARARAFFDEWTTELANGGRAGAARALVEQFRLVREDERAWCGAVAARAIRVARSGGRDA